MKYKFQVQNRHFDVEITNIATFHSETTVKIDKNSYNVSVGEYHENGK